MISQKQVIGLAIAVTVSFTILILGMFAVYKFYPTILGLPPNQHDTTKVASNKNNYVEPRVVISKNILDKYQHKLLDYDILKGENKFYNDVHKILKDSLSRFDNRILFIKDSLQKIIDTLKYRESYYSKLQDSIIKVNSLYNKAVNETISIREKIKDRDKAYQKKYDSLQVINFQTFAKIYDNSNPADVAKILEQIDEHDAAMILKRMKKKNAGKVLEAMLPENAAAILLLGVGD